jgi:hypothetical protein
MRLLATVPVIGVEAVAYQTMNGKTITFRSTKSLISEKINCKKSSNIVYFLPSVIDFLRDKAYHASKCYCFTRVGIRV